MKKQMIAPLFGAVLFALAPVVTHASVIQHLDGGAAAVYLDYKHGADELVVSNIYTDENFQLDLYASETPKQEDSWVLERSYKGHDVDPVAEDEGYGLWGGKAVRFNGAQYFAINVQAAGEDVSLPAETQVWRVTKRGGKPQLVLRHTDTGYYPGQHMPLIKLNGELVFLGDDDTIYRSSNGKTWTLTDTISEAIDNGYHADLISDGSTAWLSVNGGVYTSTDATTWTSIGDICEEEASCEVDSIQLRPASGIFAIASNYAEDTPVYKLWTYTSSGWKTPVTLASYVSAFQNVGDRTYMMIARGTSGYKHIIKKVTKKGVVKKVTQVRKGSPVALLADGLYAVNRKDAAYITLVDF